MTSGRRTLVFDGFDAIPVEVDWLLTTPHTTVGQWSLAQVCEHLAVVTRRLVDAPASTPFDPSQVCSPEEKARVFASGLLPEGIPLAPNMASPTARDAREQAAAFRDALAHYAASATGPVLMHRVFGPLSKDEWDHLVRMHCAHHLSFVVPDAG